MEHCIGFLHLALNAGLDLLLLFKELGFSVLLLGIRLGISDLQLPVLFSVGFLLGRLSSNLGSDKVFGTETLELGGCFLGLDILLKFGVTGFGSSASLDLGHLNAHVQFSLPVCEFSIGLRLLGCG
jgi:hypothetical protein